MSLSILHSESGTTPHWLTFHAPLTDHGRLVRALEQANELRHPVQFRMNGVHIALFPEMTLDDAYCIYHGARLRHLWEQAATFNGREIRPVAGVV